MVEIGAVIRRARRAIGWSQRDLAHRAGIGQSHVLRVEQGTDIRLSTLQKLADALDADFIMVPRQVSHLAQRIGDVEWQRMGRGEMTSGEASDGMLFTIENTAEEP